MEEAKNDNKSMPVRKMGYHLCMVGLSGNSHALCWLKQFDLRDQGLAVDLLDAIILVSRDEFTEKLRACIQDISEGIDGPIGLYVEREVKKCNQIPNRLFKESRNKPKRAEGSGPKIIETQRGRSQEIGSEGIIGQLVTDLRREDRSKFFIAPGPEEIRNKKIKAFVLVTDFIGSGKRVEDYLTAAWSVASVKSWVSQKYLSFHVAAFSGTEQGIQRVRFHKSRPQVHQVRSCPTIFDLEKAEDIIDLCKKYNPFPKFDAGALGFGGIGGLMAFSHGAPNNLPMILHKKGRDWRPLFSGRSTAAVRSIFGETSDKNGLANRLKRLKQTGITTNGWLRRNSPGAQSLILLMAALKFRPRFDDILSRRTGLTIPEIRFFICQLEKWNWVNDKRRLTDEGYKQLRHARKPRKAQKELSQPSTEHYYPKSLRMPQ